MSEVQLFSRELFVFVDETGCSGKDHIRKFGYALGGEMLYREGGFTVALGCLLLQ